MDLYVDPILNPIWISIWLPIWIETYILYGSLYGILYGSFKKFVCIYIYIYISYMDTIWILYGSYMDHISIVYGSLHGSLPVTRISCENPIDFHEFQWLLRNSDRAHRNKRVRHATYAPWLRLHQGHKTGKVQQPTNHMFGGFERFELRSGFV